MYESPHVASRNLLWQSLKEFGRDLCVLWAIIRDFNVVLSMDKRYSGTLELVTKIGLSNFSLMSWVWWILDSSIYRLLGTMVFLLLSSWGLVLIEQFVIWNGN